MSRDAKELLDREEPVVAESWTAPLSFGQQRLWFLDRLEPGKSIYSIARAYRLLGRLDAAALRHAFADVVRRHAVLRTTFPLVDGEPVQLIGEEGRIELPVIDLSAVAETERDLRARRRAAFEASRPFDLANGPLLRAELLRLGPAEHILVVTVHHTVFDGWSEGVLLRELEAFYRSHAAGRPAALPELAIQYGDFAAWQRDRLGGERLERLLDYWRGKLGGAPPLLALPTDRPRPPVQTYRGDVEPIEIKKPLLEAVRTLACAERASVFMALLAGFLVLLKRYSGQDDLSVGCPVAGRDRPETEPLIGLFTNTLVFRSSLAGDPTVRELLGRVRDTALDAYDHQELPLEKLVAELSPERSLSHSPLFQVMFALQNVPRQGERFADLKLGYVDVAPPISKFDVSLFLVESDSWPGLDGVFEYSTDLFTKETVRRMSAHYRNLLEAMVADPARPISRLPMLDASETALVARWGAADRQLRETPVHRLFEERARATPDAIAVSGAAGALTYGELDRSANRLARVLARHGVSRDVPVAFALERTPRMIVALLAILKAGGAYLPLDPSHPKERLAFLLRDSSARVLLTERALLGRMPDTDAEKIALDADAAALAAESDAAVETRVGADDLAYVVYTSGSTGAPKGVLVPHRGVANVLASMARTLGITERDVFVATTPLSFDIASFECFMPLVSGARLVIATREQALHASALQTLVETSGATVLQATPSTWRALLDSGFEGRASGCGPAPLRLLSAGEALTRELADRLLPRCAALYNAYGPSETTIYSTVQEVRREEGPVPIGRPLDNTTLHVVDAALAPAPRGVPGELLIGGAGVARSYLARPELTAERFLDAPALEDGRTERVYRTGDLVRWRSDGELEYLGRLDDQVKVRGVRIELGEVEAALSRCPDVKECAVALREKDGDGRLVGYVVPRAAAGPSTAELRRHLALTLPEHMIPSAFVTLAALPANANGKLDRRALPDPEPAHRDAGSSVPPRSETERALAGIWASVLGVASIGVFDSFFDLGGHSLLAVRLFSEIEKRFSRTLPLATIFQAPTIAQLAALLEDQEWKPSWSSLVPIRAEGTKPPFFCVHAIGGNVLTYFDLTRHLGSDQPVYGLQAQGLDGKRPLFDTVEEMAAHYIAEIRSLRPAGPYDLGGSSAGGLVAFEMARQLRAAGEDVRVLALFDTWGPDYPKRVPGMSPLRVRVARIVERIDLHAGNFLVANGPREKLRYLVTKYRRLTDQLVKVGKRRLDALRLAVANPIPKALRRVEKQSRRAIDVYAPKPYRGRVTLFRASKQPAGYVPDPELGWTRVAEGGLDVHEVPGYHGAIVYEPRVGALAERLRACLEGKGREEPSLEPRRNAG